MNDHYWRDFFVNLWRDEWEKAPPSQKEQAEQWWLLAINYVVSTKF